MVGAAIPAESTAKWRGRRRAYQVGELRRGRRRCRVLRLCEALQRLRGREKQRRGAQALRRRDSEAAIRRRRRNSCAVAPGARRGGTRSLRRSRPRGAVRIRRLAAHGREEPLCSLLHFRLRRLRPRAARRRRSPARSPRRAAGCPRAPVAAAAAASDAAAAAAAVTGIGGLAHAGVFTLTYLGGRASPPCTCRV